MLWSDPAPLVAGLAIALLAVWLVVVGRGAVEGHELHSVTLVSAGIYAVMLVGVVVVPAATPILVLTTLVPLSFAAPYLSPQQLGRASVTEAVVWLSCVGTAAAILLLTGQGIDNRFALYAIGSAGVMLLVFFLLDQSIRTATGLREIALRDGLTGLHNRTLFVDRLEHAMTRAKRHTQPAGPAGIDRGHLPRRRRLQGHQRPPRARVRRPGAAKRRPTAEGHRASGGHRGAHRRGRVRRSSSRR